MLRNRQDIRVARAVAPILVALLGFAFGSCSPRFSGPSGWDRYQPASFRDAYNDYSGELSFEMENTIRIHAPMNAQRSVCRYLGEQRDIAEGELMVLQGKFQGSMSKEKAASVFQHSVHLSSEGQDAWFCIQEPVYEAMLALDTSKPITVLYQFAGSTNIGGDAQLVFAVMAWLE